MIKIFKTTKYEIKERQNNNIEWYIKIRQEYK